MGQAVGVDAFRQPRAHEIEVAPRLGFVDERPLHGGLRNVDRGHGRDEHHRGADPDADGACGRPAEHAREAEHPAQAEHDVEDEPGQEFA